MEELTLSREVREVKELEEQLLILRLSVGKLRAAMERAFAPLGTVLLPPVNRALHTLIGWCNDAAAVLAALFGLVRMESVKTAKVSGSAMKRSLAGFDTLERLQGRSGGGGFAVETVVKELPERLKPALEKLQALLAPLQQLDLSAAAAAFEKLKQAVEPLTRGLFSALEWAWYQIFVPMAQWGAQQLLPAFLDAMTAALTQLNACITAAKPALQWFWEKLLVPMGQWTGQALLAALGTLQTVLTIVGGTVRTVIETVTDLTGIVDMLTQALRMGGVELDLFGKASDLLHGGMALLVLAAEQLHGKFQSIATAVSLVHAHLTAMMSQLEPTFRGVANAAIASVNLSLSGIESVLNTVASILSSIRVTIPAWVPGLGGKQLGLTVNTVSLPRVPYLAQGAVLPANKPFLAVVGDQKRGTNVEAPLDVIRQAVAEVLAAQPSRTDALLEQLLHAVDGITVGDETIGRAARRYEQRMAVMGGVV